MTPPRASPVAASRMPAVERTDSRTGAENTAAVSWPQSGAAATSTAPKVRAATAPPEGPRPTTASIATPRSMWKPTEA